VDESSLWRMGMAAMLHSLIFSACGGCLLQYRENLGIHMQRGEFLQHSRPIVLHQSLFLGLSNTWHCINAAVAIKSN